MRHNQAMAIRYWLGVVHRDHVLRGVEHGFAQLNHGTKQAISRLREADGLIYYSPRVSGPESEPLREFTAIGRIADDTVFQDPDGAVMTNSFGEPYRPWRRRVDYDPFAVAAPIRPLIPVLDFTSASPNWGFQLRRGLIELSKSDFEVIKAQMRATQ